MKTYTVKISPSAKSDVGAPFDWYKERSAKAATSFRAEVLAVFDRLTSDPDQWARQDETVRRFVMRQLPYTVYFEVVGQVVWILAVGHHSKKPNYWGGRHSAQ